MSWAVPIDTPSTLPYRPTLATQQSSSLPSTPYQHPRDLPFRSRSRSPHRGGSPRSTHSELNHVLPPPRKHYVCKYETGMAHFRRRIPYSLGSELLPEEPGPLKENIEPKIEEKLSSDMRTLYNSLLPSSESEERRSRFVQKLEKLLNEKWPGNDIKVHVFGSSGNKLCSSDSDVDICITTPFKGLERVCMLADFLAKSGMERVVCVSDAKVPIVKIWDPELRLACDMNVNNTTALENTRMIRTYVEVDERVRQLAMIIKHWTKRRILNDAALGGTLSSYTWICLIINFLQTRSPPILPSLQQRAQKKNMTEVDGSLFDDDLDNLAGFGDDNKSSLGALLFQFFRYYGHEIDYEKKVMSVREGKLISKEEKRWHLLQNNRLCVEEPFTTSRNLGNTADDTAFRGLHMELRRAFKAISEGKLDECCEQYEYPPEEERIWERPAPQRRPIIAPVPPLSSRGGRGGGRGGRRSSNFNRGPDASRRSSSAANRQGNSKQSNPGFTTEIALQAQQAQYLLHDHLYQQIQMLQAQEHELRMQLQNQTLMSGRSPPTVMRPYMQVPSYPQQDNASSTASDETPRARAGTVNHPPLSAPLRQPVMYNPSFLPVSVPTDQGTHTNPSSPSVASATPESRRCHRRSSAANGSPRSNLRAQSQPARPQQSPMLQRFGATAFNVAGQQDESQSSGSQQGQVHGSPQGRPPDRGTFSANGVPMLPKSTYVDENLPPEYIGYYVGDSPQYQAGYLGSMATSLPGTSPLPIHSGGFPGWFDSRQLGVTAKEQLNSVSESSDTQSPPQGQPLTRSKTVPDCGPLIIDGSHRTHTGANCRQSSPADSQDYSHQSQSAPSSNDRANSTPGGTSDIFSHDLHEQLNHENESGGVYDKNRQELRNVSQVNGWESHLKTRNPGINGHIGTLETLSERLQRFQMSDPTVNGESYGASNLTPYRSTKGYSHATQNDMLGLEQPTTNNKPVRSPNLVNVTKEPGVAPPPARRRVNGAVDSDTVNGVATQKAQTKPRHGPPNKILDHKDKHTEPSSRKPNGVHHSNGHGGNSHSTNTGGWQTTRRKHRKGARAQTQSNGVEPLPADESLRKGG